MRDHSSRHGDEVSWLISQRRTHTPRWHCSLRSACGNTETSPSDTMRMSTIILCTSPRISTLIMDYYCSKLTRNTALTREDIWSSIANSTPDKAMTRKSRICLMSFSTQCPVRTHSASIRGMQRLAMLSETRCEVQCHVYLSWIFTHGFSQFV